MMKLNSLSGFFVLVLMFGMSSLNIFAETDSEAGLSGDSAEANAAPDGPPAGMFLNYQMREELPIGDRLSSRPDQASALYSNLCGSCHLNGGMGTNILTVQRMKLGESPAKGLLTNRDDLAADYVKRVVRGGKRAMPRLTRVDITDAELENIAQYLAKVAP